MAFSGYYHVVWPPRAALRGAAAGRFPTRGADDTVAGSPHLGSCSRNGHPATHPGEGAASPLAAFASTMMST